MKTSSNIIASISNQPQFRLLKTHICYNKFLALLPPRYSSFISHTYIKNGILYFAITHPGIKAELHYNLDLFKSLLAMVERVDCSCSFTKVEKVNTFIPKRISQAILEREETTPYYGEKSTANFDINTKDDELQKAYEDIKKAILCNQ